MILAFCGDLYKMKFQYLLLVIIIFVFSCTPGIKQIEEIRSPEIRVLLNTINQKDAL